jgi:ABC-type hemin transport system ATPase subunit
MAIDPTIFNVDDLDLDRLASNLVESTEAIELVELALRQSDIDPVERAKYQARLGEEQDQVDLLRKLIVIKRDATKETING